MNKEQQIEEMANYYCEYCKKQTGEKFCEHIDDKSCNIFYESELFYNAGYRKIPEDSVVLSREEYEQLKQTIISQLEESTKLCTHLTQKIIDARKETVEKFATNLKKIIHERDYVQGYAEIGLIEEIDELLKEYKK